MKENVKMIIFLLILIPLLIFNFSKGNRLNGKELIKNGERIVRNSKKPIYGEWKFELIEDMVIGKTIEESSVFVEPWKWKVKTDGEGNIFVLDSKECKVLKFSKSGNLIGSIGRKGEGPGEFSRPGPWFVREDGTIWVYDSSKQKITKFNPLGEVIKELKINWHIWDFFIDKEELIFGLISESKEDRRVTSIVRFSKEGKIDKKLFESPEDLSTFLVSEKVVTFSHPYLFSGVLSPFDKDKFVYGYSSEYKLFIINIEGRILLRIEKKEDKIPIGGDIKKEILNWFNISPELKKRIAFAPYTPFFDDILIDNESRIYVRRLPLSSKEFEFSRFDIFSREGNFIYRADFSFEPSVIKDGFIYSIKFDEEKERYILKRYKVKNWKNYKKK